jgi:SRSO17 transposase
MSVAVADLDARTQNFFREVNERIANVNAGMSRPDEDSGRLIEVLCECGRQSCATLLRIREDDYELLRSNPIGFVLSVGHESAPVEEVVQRTKDYVIVENKGRAAVIARDGDPRSGRPPISPV